MSVGVLDRLGLVELTLDLIGEVCWIGWVDWIGWIGRLMRWWFGVLCRWVVWVRLTRWWLLRRSVLFPY